MLGRTTTGMLGLATAITTAGCLLSRNRNIELRHRLAEMTRQAYTDPLTRVLNRAGWDLRAVALAAETDVLIGLVDLDEFKPVNDTHGHSAGDAVLTHTARVLTAHVRDRGVVARLGGDEFVFALPLTHLGSNTDGWLSHLSSAIAAPIDPKGLPRLSVTASIGVAVCRTGPAPSERLSLALACADSAMYRAKHHYGGGVACTYLLGLDGTPSTTTGQPRRRRHHGPHAQKEIA